MTSNRSFSRFFTISTTLCLMLGLTACSDDAEPDTPDAAPVYEPPDYAVRVLGELFTADLAEAQAYHDPLASGGEVDAKALGDFGHDALLGTTLLGTTENQFLAIDRWDNVDGLQQFYANPDFGTAFGALFNGEPTIETFARRDDWHSWGDMTAGDGSPDYYYVMVRGRLAVAGDEGKELHDTLAGGGQADAMALGDVAHVAFLGLEDPQEFLAFDIWTDSTDIETFYGNPDFQAAFATLFDADGPTVGVYHSTDWHQW